MSSTTSSPRLAHFQLAPEPFKAFVALSQQNHGSSLGRQLLALVDIRVSQINGCAYCLDMHSREFMAHDGDLQRLATVAAWGEAAVFSERERAALQWAESLTLLGQGHAPQAHFDALRQYFTDREIVDLTLAVALINAWNRVSVGMRMPVPHRQFGS